jgi:glutaconyl-CoA/methylmalonyl-CoA decarboxylase subunit gamma
MKYFVRVGDRMLEVDLAGGAVRVDGETLEAHLAAIPGTPLHHLLLAGESWTVAAQLLSDQPASAGWCWALGVAGERVEVEVEDERTRAIQALTGRRGGAPGGGAVRAPMPGLVVRVEVLVGDRVEVGAALVVVEAMKMQNELRAARAGCVAQIHVRPGVAVEKGALLVTLDPEPGDETEPSS